MRYLLAGTMMTLLLTSFEITAQQEDPATPPHPFRAISAPPPPKKPAPQPRQFDPNNSVARRLF